MPLSYRSPRAIPALLGFLALTIACSLAAPANQLMREFKGIRKCDAYKRGIFDVDLVDNDIYRWRVRLLDVDTKSGLYADLLKLRNITGQEAEVEFELILARQDEENKPPLVRFLHPNLMDPRNPNFCQELKLEDTSASEFTMQGLIMAVREYLVKRDLRVNFSECLRRGEKTNA